MKPSILSLANNIGLVLLGLIMLSSCSTDTDEISKVYEQLSELTQQASETESLSLFSPGIYEGEWNGLFCESEKGSVEIRHDSVCFVLPEASISRFLVDVLMDTYVSEFPEEAESIAKADWQFSNTVHQGAISLQGYSYNSIYNGLKNDMTISYEMYAGEIPCRIEIMADDCTMLYDMSTKLFSIRIPFNECVFTNLVSGWQGHWKPGDPAELLFVATKKNE